MGGFIMVHHLPPAQRQFIDSQAPGGLPLHRITCLSRSVPHFPFASFAPWCVSTLDNMMNTILV